jgi:hypothetical protein
MKKMDHSAYQRKVRMLNSEALRYTIKDCQAAIRANPENPNNGYYADEINYCAMELKRRENG